MAGKSGGGPEPKKRRPAPYIPLFGDAYIADTRHLKLDEHGAYFLLLIIAWRTEGCRLPDDDNRLAVMLGVSRARWMKIKPAVMAFWRLDAGWWTQARLSKEREFVEQKRSKNKASADARWASQGVENEGEDGCERISERICETDAPPPPPIEEGKKGGGAADAATGAFAFVGAVIRLSPRHLQEWRQTFHAIPDIEAELSSIDTWLQQPDNAEKAKPGRWFHAVKGMLNRKHQEMVQAAQAADAQRRYYGP